MKTTLLSDLLKKENGEVLFKILSDSFTCKNKDVEGFLQGKAIQSSKLYTSATYLVSEISDRIDLLGYFTLATKMLTIKPSNLTATQEKKIRRFVSIDVDTGTYKLPAVLLAQLGRNFSESSQSIKGLNLMRIALERIEKAVSLTSGKLVFLECEPSEKLIALRILSYRQCPAL